jgi:hypothetical protein
MRNGGIVRPLKTAEGAARGRPALRFAINLVVLVASLLAFVIIIGIGLVAAGVQESGERAAGLALAFVALLAFGSALFLLFAPSAFFATAGRRMLAVAASMAALAPVIALAWAALQFAGLPIGSRAPAMDWGAFALGAILLLGAMGIVALGYRRLMERPIPSLSDPRVSATELSQPYYYEGDDDIKVTRV